jgi:hypothetical protein
LTLPIGQNLIAAKKALNEQTALPRPITLANDVFVGASIVEAPHSKSVRVTRHCAFRGGAIRRQVTIRILAGFYGLATTPVRTHLAL